jgi:hypothetical protein
VSDCEHNGTFEVSTEIALGEPSGERMWIAVLGIRCAMCRQRFAWRGFNSGQPNPQEAVVSADGYELRAPIIPQPTGVVGMLRSAGLEHLLGPDGPRLG